MDQIIEILGIILGIIFFVFILYMMIASNIGNRPNHEPKLEEEEKNNQESERAKIQAEQADRKTEQIRQLYEDLKNLRFEHQQEIKQIEIKCNNVLDELKSEHSKEIKRLKDEVEQIHYTYENLNQVVETLDLNNVFDDYPEWLIPQYKLKDYQNSLASNRLIKANQNPFIFQEPIQIACQIKSQSDDSVYRTTLTDCTCIDFQRHKTPCKHMLALAIRLNAFIGHEGIIDGALDDIAQKMNNIEEKEKQLKKEKAKVENAKKIVTEKQQTYPFLASLMANYKISMLDIAIKEHVTKKDMTAKLKKSEKEKAMLQNQIAVYEYMFPILREFQDVPPLQLSQTIENSQTTEFHYQWLEQEEYAALTSEEKQQKWIERYLSGSSKSNWEAGIKYERYIGYLCEKEGCIVKYTGATLKLNDMGRDLIATKGKTIYVIQCKRYSQEKEIHENHLFQLFGSVAHYKKEHPNFNVTGVFVTSSHLSEVAKQCAESLSVLLYENIPFENYPTIKCNIGKNKEKIYHLPFDQQYDNITIQFSKGEFYVDTIAEAQSQGFRHAMKHTL